MDEIRTTVQRGEARAKTSLPPGTAVVVQEINPQAVDLASDIGASLAVSEALKQAGLNVGSKEPRDALEAFAKAMGKRFLREADPKTDGQYRCAR